MSCKVVQREITESLVAGLLALTPEVFVHCRSCAGCRAFYEKERELFAALGFGLQDIVNQAMPASVLPRVRAGLNKVPERASYRLSVWSFVAAFAVMTLILCVTFVRNLRQPLTVLPTREPATAKVSGSPLAPLKVPKGLLQPDPAVSPTPVAKRSQHAFAGKAAEAMPEVMVLAEERKAYASYLASRGREARGTVVASATSKPDSTIEIALLQIQKMEIQPLEGTAQE